MVRTLSAVTVPVLLLAVAPAAPVPKPEPTLNYFPTVVGDTRVYSRGGTDTVTAVEKKGGALFVTVTYDDDGTKRRMIATTYRVSADGVYQVGNPGKPEADVPPTCVLRLPPAPGEKYARYGSRALTMTTHEPEDVAVKAGVFRAVRIVTEWPDGKGGVLDRTTEWYAPGVGCVKSMWEGPIQRESELVKFIPGTGYPPGSGK